MCSDRWNYDEFEWTPPDRLAELAQGETPWRYYLDTVVHVDLPDCRGTVRPVEIGTGQKVPPAGALHVITAIQPDSDPGGEDSAARMALLDHHVEEARLRALPVVGASTDGSYREDSRAVLGLSDEQARALGRRFGQVAVFGWNGATWSLMACAGDRRTDRGWLWEVR